MVQSAHLNGTKCALEWYKVRTLMVHIHAQGRERMAEARQRLSARQSHGSASDDELDNVDGASDEESVRAVVCVRAGAIEGWADTKGRQGEGTTPIHILYIVI